MDKYVKKYPTLGEKQFNKICDVIVKKIIHNYKEPKENIEQIISNYILNNGKDIKYSIIRDEYLRIKSIN